MQPTRFDAILILELCCFLLLLWLLLFELRLSRLYHIWSPGVSVASIRRYLLVFYYKLFYESTLNKEYIT